MYNIWIILIESLLLLISQEVGQMLFQYGIDPQLLGGDSAQDGIKWTFQYHGNKTNRHGNLLTFFL